jgi:preprotein translocase subunit SecG
MDQDSGYIKWGLSLVAGIGLIALGWKFFWVLVTLHVLLCFVLILVVLLQSGKAADLAGAFGGAGSQTAFGPRGAATFLSKATTWCFIMFLLSTLSLTIRESKGLGRSTSSGSVLEKTQKAPEPASAPTGTPQTPAQGAPATPAPTQQQQQPPPVQPPAKQ